LADFHRPPDNSGRYLRLGQPATELSGGEARVELPTELERSQRGRDLHVLD